MPKHLRLKNGVAIETDLTEQEREFRHRMLIILDLRSALEMMVGLQGDCSHSVFHEQVGGLRVCDMCGNELETVDGATDAARGPDEGLRTGQEAESARIAVLAVRDAGAG